MLGHPQRYKHPDTPNNSNQFENSVVATQQENLEVTLNNCVNQLNADIIRLLEVCSISDKNIRLQRLDDTFVRAAKLLSRIDNSMHHEICIKFIELINTHILPYIHEKFQESYSGMIVTSLQATQLLASNQPLIIFFSTVGRLFDNTTV